MQGADVQTYHNYESDGAKSLWGVAGTDVEAKRHVLCCKSEGGGEAEEGREGM